MDFNNEDFGIQSTELMEGTPQLFSSSPEDVEPIKEEPIQETKKDGFDLNDNSSPMLFAEEEPETPAPAPPETTIKNTEEVPEEPTPSEEEPETNMYSVFQKTLLDEGIFTSDDEEEQEITTPEQLLERFRIEGQKMANDTINSFLGKYGPDRIDFFNAVYVNGVAPEDYFKVEQKLESVKSIDLESVENQEMVISQYYKSIGWNNEKIKKHLKRLDEDGETESEAMEAHSHLLQVEQKALQDVVQQQTQAAQAREQEKLYYNHHINNIVLDKLKAKEFDGIPVTDKVAKTTVDFLTTEKWQLPNGDRLSDFDKWVMDLKRPENYEARVKVALLAQNGFDFTKIKTKAVVEKTNKLFDGLQRKEKVTTRNQQPNTGFSI